VEIGLSLSLTSNKGVGVSLQAFMAGQSDGLWYDFSKTDRLFQESVGPTPANDPNEVIGLALSQRTSGGQTLAQVLAAASELFAPGSSVDASTAPSTSSESPPGTITVTGDGTNNARRDFSITTVAGRSYRMVCTGATAAAFLRAGSVVGGNQSLDTTTVIGANEFFFTATTATTWVRFLRSTAGPATVSGISIKEVSRYAATQATTGFKPKYQAAGATFDATDDNLLTGYLAQNGANFIVAYVDVPATLAATQVVAGASGAAANRCFLAFNTSGQLCAGVGSDSTATIVGTTDWRSQSVVIGLSFDGSTVKLFAGTAEEYSAAQNSTPTTTIPFRIGALNNNGTAGSFSGLAIKDLLVGRQALTLAQFKSIRTQLIAGA